MNLKYDKKSIDKHLLVDKFMNDFKLVGPFHPRTTFDMKIYAKLHILTRHATLTSKWINCMRYCMECIRDENVFLTPSKRIELC